MKLVSFVLLFCSVQAFAYRPTVESLFRNGSNGDIGQNTVMATFVLKRKEKPADTSDTIKELPSVTTFRMLISNDTSPSKLVQVAYNGEIASSETINSVRYFPRFSLSSMRLGSEDAEKKFFYSLLGSLINNQGDLMVRFLNDMGVSIQPNRERVDKEQLYYLGKYVKYLKLDDAARSGQENPMEPTDPETSEKLREIFKRPFLTPSPYVKRVKEGSEFFWVLESDKVLAKFSHDDHKLLEMVVKTDNGNISVKCLNYILYGQDMQFPELVLLKDLAGDEYLLNMKKITHFSDSPERFSSRLGDYNKALEKAQSTENQLKPSFTL